ncbi:hypothetical protein C8Q80DRAFT_643191 [Daedaleopsis nitida]|nr:hypothetical protein C8Q80DRAFT_643191 [Daedaleopsis nitida]
MDGRLTYARCRCNVRPRSAASSVSRTRVSAQVTTPHRGSAVNLAEERVSEDLRTRSRTTPDCLPHNAHGDVLALVPCLLARSSHKKYDAGYAQALCSYAFFWVARERTTIRFPRFGCTSSDGPRAVLSGSIIVHPCTIYDHPRSHLISARKFQGSTPMYYSLCDTCLPFSVLYPLSRIPIGVIQALLSLSRLPSEFPFPRSLHDSRGHGTLYVYDTYY